MSIRRQDIGVLLLYCCGYSRIKNLILRLKRKPVARFVTFHGLLPTALNSFERNLNFLKSKTNVVSFDNFMAGRLSYTKVNVVITFDDGFKSWITHAVPILQRFGLPATFFISAGFIGLAGADEMDFIQSKLLLKQTPNNANAVGLTYDDVREIADKGFTIGGHTLNHCNLSELHDSDKIKYEITEDKLRLEKITGTRIDYFAYPSGAYKNQNINLTEVLKESGYRGAVTTVSGYNDANTNPYLLHRELTGAAMPTPVFKARVYGNYDAIQFLKQKILRQ